MKVLFIITNMLVLAEELSAVSEKYDQCSIDQFFCINTDYVRSSSSATQLSEKIESIFPGFQQVQYAEAFEYAWDVIVSPSFIQKKLASVLTVNYPNSLLLVEDGTYDYLATEVKYQKFTKLADLYLSRPDLASAAVFYNSVHKLEIHPAILARIMSAWDKDLRIIHSLPCDTPIVFTSPLAEDYEMMNHSKKLLSYVEGQYAGQTVLLKKHPRDLQDYKSSVVTLQEVNSNVPGQFLDQMFTGPKIYEFPSTISFFSKNVAQSKIIHMKSPNRAYNQLFEYDYFKNFTIVTLE